MRAPDQDVQQWRAIATIETHAGVTDVHRLIDRGLAGVRFQRVAGAPPSLRWFNVLIDAGDGEDRYERAARAVLRMLHRAVEAGRISEFRVVESNQWLTQRHGGAAQESEH
jgi:hypothetical protein